MPRRRPFIRGGTSLDNLSQELLVNILEYLPRRSLRKVASVSKRFYILCISILYKTVDLSVVDHHSWISPEADRKVAARQWHFVQQILKKPEYGQYVQNLVWTMELLETTVHTVNGKDLASIWSKEELIKAFSHLSNVRKLDIGSDGPQRRLVPIPKALFPRAVDIRLRGHMHWTFPSAILHGPGAASLESLALDNVLESGVYHGDTIQGFVWNIQEDWPKGSAPVSVKPSCMRRLATPALLARCGKDVQMRRLYLRKQGHQHREQDCWFQQDQEIYDEWADLIRCGRPRELIIQHGGWDRPEYGARGWRTRGPIRPLPPQDMAPMDGRFMHTLLPILQNGWDGLERLVIKGVSSKAIGPLALDGVEVKIIEEVETCQESIVP